MDSVTLSDKVDSVDGEYLLGCHNLKNIGVSPGNPNFTVVDGVLFDKEMKELIFYLPNTYRKSYAVPNGVSSIADYAFSGCGDLRTVIVGENVAIGEHSFHGCDSLTVCIGDETLQKLKKTLGKRSGTYTINIEVPSGIRQLAVDFKSSHYDETGLFIPHGLCEDLFSSDMTVLDFKAERTSSWIGNDTEGGLGKIPANFSLSLSVNGEQKRLFVDLCGPAVFR